MTILGPAPDAPICEACGEPWYLELVEIWPEERAFQLATCCEDSHAWAIEDLGYCSRRSIARWFRDQCGIRIRQVYDDCHWIRIDFGLELCPVEQGVAQAFVDRYHRHHDAPPGWRWGHGLTNAGELIAVAMVGRPVSPGLDPRSVVEVNRVCARDDIHGALTWNACSMLYGAAAREAAARGFERAITYTLESEPGTSLKAAGWIPDHVTRGESWDRASRPRSGTAPTCPKVRWVRELDPAPPAQLELPC